MYASTLVVHAAKVVVVSLYSEEGVRCRPGGGTGKAIGAARHTAPQGTQDGEREEEPAAPGGGTTIWSSLTAY